MVAGLTSTNSGQNGGNLGSLKNKLLSAPSRPVLSHLNADTSWLLSLPYPSNVDRPQSRTRFNILIDPWFTGSQSDVASWFSTQYHAIPSSIQSTSTLNDILAEAEGETPTATSYIDAAAISHEFTDHCHRATLEELPPSTPIFTTTKAAELVRSWSHFTTVIDIPSLTPTTDWRTTSIPPLPPWLGISRLVTEGNSLYYHSALVICLAKPNSPNNTAEAIIYTPHGVESVTFAQITIADPPIETLAFLHGLHDVAITLSKQLNLGAHNAFKAQKLLKPRYWVGTHDEVKRGLGLIGPFLRRKAWTIQDAIAQAATGQKASGAGVASDGEEEEGGAPKADKEADKLPWVDLGNGETLVLQ